ncbi:MAG TPA: hypothetical protein DCZ51_04365 [Bacteroidales bacterium]|nr:hypothetical protein [Bacteroidales bacterium]
MKIAEPCAEFIGANEEILFNKLKMSSHRFQIILFGIVCPPDEVIPQRDGISNNAGNLLCMILRMNCAKGKTIGDNFENKVIDTLLELSYAWHDKGLVNMVQM